MVYLQHKELHKLLQPNLNT